MPESQTYGTVGAFGSKVIEQDVYQLVDSLLWVQKVASSSLAILMGYSWLPPLRAALRTQRMPSPTLR
eukprot:COSAG01_NODE_8_length_44037_cov_102.614593_35_plen_68_part_00